MVEPVAFAVCVAPLCPAVKVFATSFNTVSALYACTSLPIAKPKAVLASDAEVDPVPPPTTANAPNSKALAPLLTLSGRFAEPNDVRPVTPFVTGTVGKLLEPTAPPKLSSDTSTMFVPSAYAKYIFA